MISIRNSLSELERCHQQRAAALECYVGAIRNMAHYTVELEPAITDPQRQHLNQLAHAVSENPTDLDQTVSTLRGLLRNYRDKAAKYLSRLYEELAGTTFALEQIMGTLSQTDGEHDARLRTGLERLREISRAPECAPIRPALTTSIEAIGKDLEQMRQQHRLTISQFQVEIGVLHKRIDALEAAASVDKLTELLNRREIEDRILRAPPGYTMLLVRLNGSRAAELQWGADVAKELIGAFTKRLRNALPATAIIGRWGQEEFAAILALTNRETTAIAKSISEQLTGSYSCLKDGKAVRPSLQLTVAVVDSEGQTAERVLERLRGFLTSSAAA